METCVIVANNARARIFVSHNIYKHLSEQEDFVHSEARLSNRELASDAAGKSRDPHGSYDPATSPTAHEAESFALLLTRRLKELHNERHFEQLILIAPPAFLGLLRKNLRKPLDKLIQRSIDKDLTTAGIEELLDYLRD
ncbi:host attachment protein [Congregibacter variabilis]|uniref:Host attachment protein n=1 Tax=Congregibacter variabilis TaxID=3081200 RepID=A0ABZ0I398_9GAMM|nr:host attachment protein [Congregibacter sp. IMCC43200]